MFQSINEIFKEGFFVPSVSTPGLICQPPLQADSEGHSSVTHRNSPLPSPSLVKPLLAHC